jgi:two-component system LytT family response regulator
MISINCIIAEDEPLARERVIRFAAKLPFLQLLSVFDNGEDALVFLQTHRVDLIFLDIHLGNLSGIQLLEALQPDSEIILTTAYNHYALKGYELQVTDYLLKPFTFARFVKAVERARANLETKADAEKQGFLFIKTAHRMEKIFLDDILYIEGMRDYRKIHTAQKKVMTLQTFTWLEREIAPEIICRVHKSYMVSLSKIDSVEKNSIRVQETIIPISDTYKKIFSRLLKGKSG